MSFIENCRQIVGLDSTPNGGTKEIGEFVAKLCASAQLEVEVRGENLNGVEQSNVIARPPGTQRQKEIVFQTHLDTADAGNFLAWNSTQHNPFNASIYDGVMYGLGVADTKLDLLCKLEAFRQVGAKSFRRPPVLVGTFGAQLGMVGAIKLMRRKLIQPAVVIVGEPTSMRIGISGQGIAVVEVSVPFSREEAEYREQHDEMESVTSQSKIFSGKAAHSSDPSLGDNAIIKMLEYLVRLPEGIVIMELDGGINHNTVPASAVLEIDIVSGIKDPMVKKLSKVLHSLRQLESELRAFSAPGYFPPHPTLNLGMIRTLPDRVVLTGSCRIPAVVPDQMYEGWIRRLHDECETVGATFSVVDYKSAFRTAPEAASVRAAQKVAGQLGLATETTTVSASTEANVFSRFGAECLVLGPGQGVGNSHAPNENIKIEELQLAVTFYRQLIEELCL